MTLDQAEMERRERAADGVLWGVDRHLVKRWMLQAHSRICELESALRVQKRRADEAEEACSEAERALREQTERVEKKQEEARKWAASVLARVMDGWGWDEAADFYKLAAWEELRDEMLWRAQHGRKP